MNAVPTTSILQFGTHNHDQLPETLSPSSVWPSPFDQFRQWLDEALKGSPEVAEPKDMSVATVTANGVPSVRIIRLDSFDERGFVFCTSYVSRKSQELDQNPAAALAFHWKESRKQVRIVGRAEKISDEESDEYFKSRPLAARIAAHAVQQSAVIGEEELELASGKVKREYGVADESDEDVDIARPESWGGWRVIPREVEFWSGKPDRLHDRVRYLREGESWRIERLAP